MEALKLRHVFVVTGGNGYLGSHMCRHLSLLGHEVHIIDNLSSSPPYWVHAFGTFHRLDIDQKQEVTELLSRLRPKAVFHFAAKCLVEEGEKDPLLYYRENVQKTLSLLESCVEAGTGHFIFSSTCAVFGRPLQKSIDENHPKNPVNTYGISKRLLELAMEDLASKKLINILVFRYFNASGCSPDGSLGENHEPESHLLPNLIRSFLSGGRREFHIFGNDYATPDGTCVRDYVHVEDLVKVHFAGLEFLEEHPGFHDFNLGSEQGHSVLEVVEAFEKVVGAKISKSISPRRAGDPAYLVGDSAKAKRLLGFRCQYGLEDSLRHTLMWFAGKQKENLSKHQDRL